MTEHKSVDGYPIRVGEWFWDNDLKQVQITQVAAYSNAYADTGCTQTWHKHTRGASDTLDGRMQPYGRLIKYYNGKIADPEMRYLLVEVRMGGDLDLSDVAWNVEHQVGVVQTRQVVLDVDFDEAERVTH